MLLPHVQARIRVLADSLKITPPELLMLAREAAGDSKIRSVLHLRGDPAELLFEALQIVKWTRTLGTTCTQLGKVRHLRGETIDSLKMVG